MRTKPLLLWRRTNWTGSSTLMTRSIMVFSALLLFLSGASPSNSTASFPKSDLLNQGTEQGPYILTVCCCSASAGCPSWLKLSRSVAISEIWFRSICLTNSVAKKFGSVALAGESYSMSMLLGVCASKANLALWIWNAFLTSGSPFWKKRSHLTMLDQAPCTSRFMTSWI